MTRPEIWVTRPQAQATALLQLIEQAGYSAQAVPTLEIVAAADPDTLALQAKRRLTAATMAVFISRNAVDWLWRLPVDSMRLLNDCRLFAVGPATAARLHEYGLTQVATPEVGADSESLLALRLLAAPHNEQILIVRGCGGRELIATTLRERGAVVEYLEVYERRAHAGTAARLPQLWRQHPPAVIVVSSPAGLAALQKMTPLDRQARLQATPLLCLGERLALRASEQGFTDSRPVAAESGDVAILAALQQIFPATRQRKTGRQNGQQQENQ